MTKLLPLTLILAVGVVAAPAAAAVTGHYLEARTSDVYTGPCFANSEVGLTGKEAILAWRVTDGAWEGADLAGLSVVAVVAADATLGDPHGGALSPEAVVLVDERADAAQRRALLALARELGGGLLADVRSVEAAPIELEVGERAGHARLAAGDVALATRGLNHHDHLCGNETVYYDPLAPTEGAVPAVTLEHRYDGGDLGKTWSSPGKRSAFVGTFSR
ncbi:MAG TPA: DUF1326 domain-containing protein [Thermoanaerobaculia bacterium]